MLSGAPNINSAAWIPIAVRDFDHTVGSIVPPAFEAYARVFHPAARREGKREVPVSWTEVAAANERKMHPAAEWGSITGSWKYQYRSTQPGLWEQAPSTGELPREVASRLVSILVAHTRDPDHGYFGVWDGREAGEAIFLFKEGTPEDAKQRARDEHAAEVAAWRELLESGASFTASDRTMHLLQGPLPAIDEFYEGSGLLRDPPSLWWPGDNAWCVGTDIDLMTTYIGGSREAVEALLGDEKLEVLAVPDDQRITWDADTVNPLPAPPG
ncbi:MAG TPA: hypothetical protein VMB05_16910 [Solirubrobacteraceae bacterium]|nr:hypothetical protein [Solirubrobacteraceae bacterium]